MDLAGVSHLTVVERRPRSAGRRFVFVASALVHLIWALCLYSDAAAMHITPLWVASQAVPDHNVLATILFLAAILGVLGAIWDSARWRPIFLLFPQQFALWSAAASALGAILQGHYADGVVRPTQFLLADQINIIVLAGLHTASYSFLHTRRVWGRAGWRIEPKA